MYKEYGPENQVLAGSGFEASDTMNVSQLNRSVAKPSWRRQQVHAFLLSSLPLHTAQRTLAIVSLHFRIYIISRINHH